MNIDNCASTVTVSGIGLNIWRDDFFPVVARLLFTQYVKFAESQVIESYTNGDADDRSKADECTNDPIRENHVPETLQQPLSHDQLTASKIAYELPVYTSTPIVNRMETQHDGINRPVVSEIIKKIDQMETELRMVKQSVISNMEKQIQDLKSSVLEMIGKIKPDMTYAAAVQSSSKPTEKSPILQKILRMDHAILLLVTIKQAIISQAVEKILPATSQRMKGYVTTQIAFWNRHKRL